MQRPGPMSSASASRPRSLLTGNGIDAWRYLRALLVAPAARTVDDYAALCPGGSSWSTPELRHGARLFITSAPAPQGRGFLTASTELACACNAEDALAFLRGGVHRAGWFARICASALDSIWGASACFRATHLRHRRSATGRYAKLSISTPMRRTQLCIGPRHPAPPSAASTGVLGATALCIVTGSAGTSSSRRWRGSA